MELRDVMYGYFITYSISVLVFCISVVTTAGKQINMTYQLAGAETFGDGYSNENGSVVTSNRMGLPDNPLKISTLLKQPPQLLFPLSYIDRRFASQKQELTLPDIISRVTYLNSLYNLRPKNTLPHVPTTNGSRARGDPGAAPPARAPAAAVDRTAGGRCTGAGREPSRNAGGDAARDAVGGAVGGGSRGDAARDAGGGAGRGGAAGLAAAPPLIARKRRGTARGRRGDGEGTAAGRRRDGGTAALARP